MSGKRMVGGKHMRRDQSTDYIRPARFQAGYEHDGYDLDTIIKIKFPAEGPESRAVKRDRLTKALRYWGRGQLRHWRADWEIYKPMMAEIERMMKSGEPVSKVKQMVEARVLSRTFKMGTSENQNMDVRQPGMSDSIDEIDDRSAKLAASNG
jgi:hypothetical protein